VQFEILYNYSRYTDAILFCISTTEHILRVEYSDTRNTHTQNSHTQNTLVLPVNTVIFNRGSAEPKGSASICQGFRGCMVSKKN